MMKRVFVVAMMVCKVVLVAGQGLVVKSTNGGITNLSYNNTVLLDHNNKIGSSYYSEGGKVIRKGGRAEITWPSIKAVQYKSQNNAWTYEYDGMDVTYQHRQQKDTLFFSLTITNTSPTDTLAGLNILPFHFEFPERPKGFQQYVPYYHYNLDGPTVITADFGKGKLVLTNEETNNAVFVGLLDAHKPSGRVYKVWVSAIPFNGMVTNGVPNIEQKLAPRKSVTYKLALRFYSSSTAEKSIAPSVLASYRSANKVKFSWTDRRPIGALFLASDAKKNRATNARGWLPSENVDLTTAQGLKQFRTQVLAYAMRSIGNLKGMNAQGMITWDIEGQEFPHAISYIGSPDKLKQVSPEMDVIADEYFALFRKAGLKTGICIRPQEFLLSNDRRTAEQKDVRDPASVLIRKIKYARNRWGCTIFYVDSNIDEKGILMDVAVFKKVREAVPDVLLIPEHQNNKYFEYTAPYEEMRTGSTGLDAVVAQTYASSFLVLNTADGIIGNGGSRKVSDEVLKNSLQQGNIFLFRAWFDEQPVNSLIRKLYSEVNRSK